MEGTELTPDQEAQFLKEAAALSGTIDKKDLPDGQGGTDNPETPPKTDNDGGEDEGGETGEEGKKETKIEKKVKKLLSKKNQAETQAEIEKNEKLELQETVKELKIESEKNKFFADHPEAKEHSEKIDSLIEEKPNLSREDAFFVLQGSGEISISRGGNSFVGRSSSSNATPKDITKGSTADMEAHLKANFNDGFSGNLV